MINNKQNFKNTADSRRRLDAVLFGKKVSLHLGYLEIEFLKVPFVQDGGFRMTGRLKFKNDGLTPYCLVKHLFTVRLLTLI